MNRNGRSRWIGMGVHVAPEYTPRQSAPVRRKSTARPAPSSTTISNARCWHKENIHAGSAKHMGYQVLFAFPAGDGSERPGSGTALLFNRTRKTRLAAAREALNWVRHSSAGLCRCDGKARCAGKAGCLFKQRNAASAPPQARPAGSSEGTWLGVASARRGTTTPSLMRLDPCAL